MKLKNIMVSVFVILSLVFPAGVVMAQEEVPSANFISPSAGILYRLDVYFDNQRLLGAKNGIDKARVAVEIANERLAEMKAVENNPVHVAIAENERDTVLKAVDNQELDVMQKQEIEERLARHTRVLESILTRFREDTNPNNDHAIPSIEKAIERSRDREIAVRNIVTDRVAAQRVVSVKRDVNELCSSSTDCDSGSCKASIGASPRCVPTLATVRQDTGIDIASRREINQERAEKGGF